MNLLAFDTSTEVMSIAVSRTDAEGRTQVWQHTGAGGAQASVGLIANVMALVQQAGLTLNTLDAVCFGAGPGSFTGLRTACSVAQGLAFGAGVPVLPVDSLLAVAEEARFLELANQTTGRITAVLDARMDEMYVADYAFEGDVWTCLQPSRLVRPEDLQMEPGALLAGNVGTVYGERLGGVGSAPCPPASGLLLLPALNPQPPSRPGPTSYERVRPSCIAALPTAAAMVRLAPVLLAQGCAVDAAHALPSYIRDKVAKTTKEREAEKAAALRAVQE
jgi:tRNA threonylcarbamoyladenosine biosynthesis protein TsaB